MEAFQCCFFACVWEQGQVLWEQVLVVVPALCPVSCLLLAPPGSLPSFVTRQEQRWNRRVKTEQQINLTNGTVH